MDDFTHDYAYEYYEARAKDIKLEDITSDENNADILAWLRDNDPDLNDITIGTAIIDEDCFVVREGDHLGWLGYFVGRNDKLRELSINDFDYFPDNINLNAFLRGVGHNRSIQSLTIYIDLGESFKSLIPFMRNNVSLRELRFNCFDIGLQCARNIALMLHQQSSLKCLTFDEEISLNPEDLVQIAAALRSQSQMEELHLCCNCVGRNGFVALGNALEGCPNLRELDLAAVNNDIDNNVDDEGLLALTEGLRHCQNLTSLLLYNMMITEEGLRSLSTLFQSDNCQLEERLDLHKMNIDDEGAAALATGLGSLPSLKTLFLRDNSIGDQGLQDLVGGLVNCNLEALGLPENMLMNSVSGMRALGTLVCRKATTMRLLNLIDCSITDGGLQSFVEGMANYCNLTRLYLSNNRSITANGLASMSSLLRSEHCSLSELYLQGINIGDAGAVTLANGLIGNKSLTILSFDSSSITARGWSAFSRLLCDASSVINTYLSNHTLVEVGEPAYRSPDTPQEIMRYLKWNKFQNQAAAICKILHSHPDIDITTLFEFNLMCLPLVVEWFEKAESYRWEVNESIELFKNRQLSAMFRFIRGMPLLAANGFRSHEMKDVRLQLELKSKKRKLDQTL